MKYFAEILFTCNLQLKQIDCLHKMFYLPNAHKMCSSLVLSLSLGVIKERKQKVAMENMFVNIAETEGNRNNSYKK